MPADPRAVPDPLDLEACLRYRDELARHGGVEQMTVPGEPITLEEWRRRRWEEIRQEERNNGKTKL